MKEVGPYFGGVPIAPDVKKLMEHYGTPEAGKLISYDELSEVLGIHRDKNRFKTVLYKWRKEMEEERNVVFVAEAGKGLRRLKEPDRVDYAAKELGWASKRTIRAHRRATLIKPEELDEHSRKRLDHVIRAGAIATGTIVQSVRTMSTSLKRMALMPRAKPEE